MKLEVIYEHQEALDKGIEEELQKEDATFSLNDALIMEKRRYAFLVELCELSNEIGFFKYWKRSHMVSVEKALEELVDCIHLLASIGISHKWNRFVKEIEPVGFWEECPLEEMFYLLKDNRIDSSGQYKQAFMVLLGIGRKLGYTEDEIANAYLDKNRINLNRLERKY